MFTDRCDSLRLDSSKVFIHNVQRMHIDECAPSYTQTRGQSSFGCTPAVVTAKISPKKSADKSLCSRGLLIKDTISCHDGWTAEAAGTLVQTSGDAANIYTQYSKPSVNLFKQCAMTFYLTCVPVRNNLSLLRMQKSHTHDT